MTPFLASMASPSVQTQYVKIHSLHNRIDLNDRTGTLGAWQQHTNRYLVYVDSECYALKVCNLYCVPESWVAEVRGRPFRKRMHQMMSKFHAPGNYPCPIEELQVLPKRYGGPGTNLEKMQSWWGPNVFHYIHQQMVRQSQKNMGRQNPKNRAMNRAMLAAMERGEIYLAGVRSDGSREMQQQPQAITDSTFIVWPTFVFQFEDSPMYGSYCMGLALQDGAAA